MASKYKAILIVTGISSIAMAIVGISYNLLLALSINLTDIIDSITNSIDTEMHQKNFNETYFNIAFYTMSAISLSFFVTLFITGVQLIRRKIYWANILLTVIFLEVIYSLTVGSSWLHPVYGLSIRAATGISNGGFAIQIFTLFPIWASALALYVKFKNSKKVFKRDTEKVPH